MPIYDYECPNCHSSKEELVSLSEADNIFCSCGVKMIRKFPTTTAIRFGDSFVVGIDRPSKEVSKKIEDFKEHPEKDPYGKWRGK